MLVLKSVLVARVLCIFAGVHSSYLRLFGRMLPLGIVNDVNLCDVHTCDVALSPQIYTLRDVEPLIAAKYGAADGATCGTAVAEHLAEQYSISEVEEALGGRKLGELFASEPGSLRALAVAKADKYIFPLRKRAVHVYSEAQRVLDFRAVCEVSRGCDVWGEMCGKGLNMP